MPGGHQELAESELLLGPRADGRPVCVQIRPSPLSCSVRITGGHPCRLHLPGWFLAVFSQGHRWVGKWGRVRKMGRGPACRQGSPPRSPLLWPTASLFQLSPSDPHPWASGRSSPHVGSVFSLLPVSGVPQYLTWHLRGIRMACIKFPP